MEITKFVEWDMWHRVPNHKSKCRNLHGHRYKAEITLEWKIISNVGASDEWMVIDFWDIKTISNEFIDINLDHGYMYQKWDKIWELATELWYKVIEVDFVPTAENIVVWLFERLENCFISVYWPVDLRLKKIVLYETPTSFVTYSPYV